MPPSRLELDWEEGVFKGLLALWRRFQLRDASADAASTHAVALEDEQRSLTVLAQLVAAEPVRVRVARDAGGVRGRDLLLPRSIDFAETHAENREILLVRTLVSAAMRRRTRGRTCDLDDPFASLRVAREACDWLSEEFPAFEAAHARAIAAELRSRPPLEGLRGRAMYLEQARRAVLEGARPWEDVVLVDAVRGETARGPESPAIAIWGDWLEDLEPVPEGASPGEEPPGSDVETEAEAPAVEGLRRVELDEEEKERGAPAHMFEKVETADSYAGGVRDLDGADELDAQLEALEEVDLGDVIRGGDAAHSVLRADVQLGLDIPDVGRVDPDERGIPYDEWDFRSRRYRPGWCTVYPSKLPRGDGVWAREALARNRRLIRELTRRLEIHRVRREPVGRQFDGEDVDLSALVDNHAQVKAGRGDDPRLYERQTKRRRDIATTVLLDISLSSDSWVENRRVLDVSRDAVLVLGEVAEQLGDALQVLAFASNTRNVCRVFEVRGWRESWEFGRGRLGMLEPQGYTRIGPALRHATASLTAEPVDKRLLLLVSDGKATDYDRYEGRYGMADVRQALRDAERSGVSAHALAVDAIARDTLPPTFGPGAWHVLPHPEKLPEVLTTVYGRLVGH